MGNWGWDHMGNGMMWGAGFGGFYMILFWAVVIAVIVVLVKWFFGDSARADTPRSKSAQDVLKERYARGEIGREEFEQKKRDLK
jgi:putative membrane protein